MTFESALREFFLRRTQGEKKSSTVSAIAELMGISRTTLYGLLKDTEQRQPGVKDISSYVEKSFERPSQFFEELQGVAHDLQSGQQPLQFEGSGRGGLRKRRPQTVRQKLQPRYSSGELAEQTKAARVRRQGKQSPLPSPTEKAHEKKAGGR